MIVGDVISSQHIGQRSATAAFLAIDRVTICNFARSFRPTRYNTEIVAFPRPPSAPLPLLGLTRRPTTRIPHIAVPKTPQLAKKDTMQSTAAPATAESPPLSFRAAKPLTSDEAAALTPSSSFDFASQPAQTSRDRSIFVCGALMADEVLDALLGGLVTKSRTINKRPGTVKGYVRCAMKGGAVEAGAMPHASSEIAGVLLELLQPVELRAIDAYMHTSFDRLLATVVTENGFGGTSEVEALMYACPPEAAELLEAREWSYSDFRERHLQAFVKEVVAPCREQFVASDVGTPRA